MNFFAFGVNISGLVGYAKWLLHRLSITVDGQAIYVKKRTGWVRFKGGVWGSKVGDRSLRLNLGLSDSGAIRLTTARRIETHTSVTSITGKRRYGPPV